MTAAIKTTFKRDDAIAQRKLQDAFVRLFNAWEVANIQALTAEQADYAVTRLNLAERALRGAK